MNTIYNIQGFTVSSQGISFILGGEGIDIPMRHSGSKLLKTAREDQLKVFEIDVDGIGVHWPLLDEDLSISGLLISAGRKDLVVKEIRSIYTESLDSKAS